MPTFGGVQLAVDLRTRDALELGLPVPVVYGNQSRPELSTGSVPFLKQRVLLFTDKQIGLGNAVPRRRRGSVVFQIHVPVGIGDKARNDLMDEVLKSFRSQLIGGATFENGRMVSSGETLNWSITGVEIPFYFDEA